MYKPLEQHHTTTNYCSLPDFGRSEQEHEHKGNENMSAKYGLTSVKHRIKLHLRPCDWKPRTGNQTGRELTKGGVPWLPYHVGVYFTPPSPGRVSVSRSITPDHALITPFLGA